jgi:hypothetical protein
MHRKFDQRPLSLELSKVRLDGKLDGLLALGTSQRAVEHGTAKARGAHNIIDVDGGVEGAGAVRVVEHDFWNSSHLSERADLHVLGAVGILGALPDLDVEVVTARIALVGVAFEVRANRLALDVAQVTVVANVGASGVGATTAGDVHSVSESGAVSARIGVDGRHWNVAGEAELHRGPVHVLVGEAGVDVDLGRIWSTHAAILRVVHDGDLLGSEGHCHEQGDSHEKLGHGIDL